MKKILNISIVSALLITSYSCKEEFLEKEPSEFITTQQLAEAAQVKPELLEGTMAGTYSLTFTSGTGGTGSHTDFGQKAMDIFGDMLCGDMALSQSVYGWYRADITEFKAMNDFTNLTNYIPWRYYYRIIRSANTVIDGFGGNDAVPELAESRWVLGQAKAIRAHSYFYLTQLFQKSYNPSEPILPLYLTLDTQNGPKVTAQEIYEVIENDLDDALILLDGFQRANKSQIDASIAKTIYAYVLTTKGEYTRAYDMAKSVIDSGEYQIMQGAELTGGFNQLGTPGWMWGVDLNSDTGVGLLSFWGQVDYFSYSYAGVGDYKVIDQDLYDQIPSDDIRKQQFFNSPTSSQHLLPINKFYDAGRTQFGAGTPVQNDLVYYRVSELYLLAAEAAAYANRDTDAINILKELVSTRVPDASYIDALSGDSLKEEIYLQTRIELWGEGKSYLAMKRNKATTRRGANHLSFVGENISYDDEKLTFEIPRAEIQNNPFISDQNQ